MHTELNYSVDPVHQQKESIGFNRDLPIHSIGRNLKKYITKHSFGKPQNCEQKYQQKTMEIHNLHLSCKFSVFSLYSGTCLIRHTKEPGKCVGLYRMSEYSGFISVYRNTLGPSIFVGCHMMSENLGVGLHKFYCIQQFYCL